MMRTVCSSCKLPSDGWCPVPVCCPSDGDAVVEVPGYDVRVIPTSGVLQTAIFWAIAGGMAGGGARL